MKNDFVLFRIFTNKAITDGWNSIRLSKLTLPLASAQLVLKNNLPAVLLCFIRLCHAADSPRGTPMSLCKTLQFALHRASTQRVYYTRKTIISSN